MNKFDPEAAKQLIAEAAGNLVTSIMRAAADAALGEVQQRLQNGAAEVSKTRSKIRRGSKSRRAPEVIEAEIIDEPPRRRTRT